MKGVAYLTEQHFDECSVWKSGEDRDGYFPVRSADELPSAAQDLLIGADFVTSNGTLFKGYIVGISRVFSIGLFSVGENYFFNSNLSDLSRAQLKKMVSALETADMPFDGEIFPLQFTTRFQFPGYNNFSGEFSL